MTKQQILKLTGLSEAEFYAKYPTKEAFYKAYPNAKKKMERGGSLPTAGTSAASLNADKFRTKTRLETEAEAGLRGLAEGLGAFMPGQSAMIEAGKNKMQESGLKLSKGPASTIGQGIGTAIGTGATMVMQAAGAGAFGGAGGAGSTVKTGIPSTGKPTGQFAPNLIQSGFNAQDALKKVQQIQNGTATSYIPGMYNTGVYTAMNGGMYRDGGVMNNSGNLGLTDLKGPSHADGGITLNEDVEVEGKETIYTPERYVFSEVMKASKNALKDAGLSPSYAGKSYSSISRSFKNSVDTLRGSEDKLAQRAVDQKLKKLIDAHEVDREMKRQREARNVVASTPEERAGGYNMFPNAESIMFPGQGQATVVPADNQMPIEVTGADGSQQVLTNSPIQTQAPFMERRMAAGGMLKRADGSYSKRGLWDNIRAKAAANRRAGKKGKKPTKAMLEQERKIKAAEKAMGGYYYAQGGYLMGDGSDQEDGSFWRSNDDRSYMYGGDLMNYPQEMAEGGKLPKGILRARLESHMSPSEVDNYMESYAYGGNLGRPNYEMYVNSPSYFRAEGGSFDNPGFKALPTYVQNKIKSNMAYGGQIFLDGGPTSKNNSLKEYNDFKAHVEKARQAIGTNDAKTLKQLGLVNPYNSNDLAKDFGELQKLRKKAGLGVSEEAKILFPHIGQQIRGTLNDWFGTNYNYGGMYDDGGSYMDDVMSNMEGMEDVDLMEEMDMNEPTEFKDGGGYRVYRTRERKGKTHKVVGPGGKVKYFGDPNLGERSKSKYGKKAFYARHRKNLAKNPFFRAYARATWETGGEFGSPDNNYYYGDANGSYLTAMNYGGMYADGGMMANPEAQGGADQQLQQIMQAVVQMLQQGTEPTEIVKALIQEGLAEEAAAQIVGSIVQEMQGAPQQQEMPMEEQAMMGMQQGSPQMGAPMMEMGGMMEYKAGGIHIDPSKRGTFTAAATKHGMGVQEFARKVLSAPEGKYSAAMRKKANFARNASKWKHAMGGPLMYQQNFGVIPGSGFVSTEADPNSYDRIMDIVGNTLATEDKLGYPNLGFTSLPAGTYKNTPEDIEKAKLRGLDYFSKYKLTELPPSQQAMAYDFAFNSEDPRASMIVAAGKMTPAEKLEMYKLGTDASGNPIWNKNPRTGKAMLVPEKVETAWQKYGKDVTAMGESLNDPFTIEKKRSYGNNPEWHKRADETQQFAKKYFSNPVANQSPVPATTGGAAVNQGLPLDNSTLNFTPSTDTLGVKPYMPAAYRPTISGDPTGGQGVDPNAPLTANVKPYSSSIAPYIVGGIGSAIGPIANMIAAAAIPDATYTPAAKFKKLGYTPVALARRQGNEAIANMRESARLASGTAAQLLGYNAVVGPSYFTKLAEGLAKTRYGIDAANVEIANQEALNKQAVAQYNADLKDKSTAQRWNLGLAGAQGIGTGIQGLTRDLSARSREDEMLRNMSTKDFSNVQFIPDPNRPGYFKATPSYTGSAIYTNAAGKRVIQGPDGREYEIKVQQ